MVVETALRLALRTRGLSWSLQRYRAARAAWDARDAWDALTVTFASLKGWSAMSADYLTLGLREAYRHGLLLAVPVPAGVLGWVMESEAREAS